MSFPQNLLTIYSEGCPAGISKAGRPYEKPEQPPENTRLHEDKHAALIVYLDFACGVPRDEREDLANSDYCTWDSGCYWCWRDLGNGTGYWYLVYCEKK
jgi:hypothetical protein